MASDIYQQRYLAHILRKKQVLKLRQRSTRPKPECAPPDVIWSRHSQRTFNTERLTDAELHILYQAARLAPSSCNRQAITLSVVRNRDKEQLDEWLVGGRNWIGKADTILLLFADMVAYKSPAEVSFMPWMDAAFMAANICIAATALGLGACFVNPNIREMNRAAFTALFNPGQRRFCGAVALGNYEKADTAPPKRELGRIFY